MRVGEMRSRWRTSTKLESPTGTSRSRGWTLKATGQGLAALADASVSASQPSSVDGADLPSPELGGAVAEPLGRVPQVQRPSTRSRRTRLRRGGAGRRLAGSRLEAGPIGVPVDQRLVGLHQRLGGVVALQTRPLELLGHVAFELHGPEVALVNRGVRRGEPRRGKLRIPPQHRRTGDELAPLLLQLLSADLVLEAGAGELRGGRAGEQPALCQVLDRNLERPAPDRRA